MKIRTKRARLAVQEGIERGDAVAELELLGLSVRVIETLDDQNIVTLEELVAQKPSTLSKIKQIGSKALELIDSALHQYHLLPEKQAQRERQFKATVASHRPAYYVEGEAA